MHELIGKLPNRKMFHVWTMYIPLSEKGLK